MKPLKPTHGGAYESALNDLEKAGRRRNFGDATKHLQVIRQLSKGLTQPVCLQYIKACLRCGQGRVARAYREYFLDNFASNASGKQKLKLESLFLRQAVEDCNMVEAYRILREISSVQLEESHLQDWLRGALRCGWVFESFAILAATSRDKWLAQTTECIIELLFSISSSVNAKSIVHIQKKWLKRSVKPKTLPEYLAKARSKLLILFTSSRFRAIQPEEIREMITRINKVEGKVQAQVKASNQQSDDTPRFEHDPSDSSLKFWNLKLHCMRTNLSMIERSKSSEREPVTFFYCAPDHVLQNFDYALWSNRAHPDVWAKLYDLRLLRPNKKPANTTCLKWPDAESLCRHCIARGEDEAAASTRVLSETVAATITKKTNDLRPLLVELGAGDGITALETSQRAAVIVNELRWNRCASIVWRMELASDAGAYVDPTPRDGELVLGGDGTKVCQLYLRDCCDEVQINFPEPPPNKEDPDNWISPRLFETVRRSLRVNGRFKLVSDQRSLMEYIDAYIVKNLLTAHQWKQGLSDNKSSGIWNFRPVHDTEALSRLNASFFGQLWSRGDKKTFQFELIKTDSP